MKKLLLAFTLFSLISCSMGQPAVMEACEKMCSGSFFNSGPGVKVFKYTSECGKDEKPFCQCNDGVNTK